MKSPSIPQHLIDEAREWARRNNKGSASQPPEHAERKTPIFEDWRSTWTDFPDEHHFDRTEMDQQGWRLRMIIAGLLKPEAEVMAAI